jgi:hypothetical protein
MVQNNYVMKVVIVNGVQLYVKHIHQIWIVIELMKLVHVEQEVYIKQMHYVNH